VLSAIEVKSVNNLKPIQMKALANATEKGGRAYLLVVDLKGNYCLFKLKKLSLAKRKKLKHFTTTSPYRHISDEDAAFWGYERAY